MVVIVVLATLVPASRRALAAIPLPALIGVHGTRLLGFLLLLLLAAGRLWAPFAPSAGWSDILAGSTAVPVCLGAGKQANRRALAGFAVE